MPSFAKLPARDFVSEVLVEGLGARHVVCGHDFAFGHGRKGTPELLLWLGDEFDFGFTCVAEVKDDDGDRLLVDPHPRVPARRPPGDRGRACSAGRSRSRARWSRAIGAAGPSASPPPTSALGEYLRPAAGVYAVRVGVPVTTASPGTTASPTSAAGRRSAAIRDRCSKLTCSISTAISTARRVRVEFIAFLRPGKEV